MFEMTTKKVMRPTFALLTLLVSTLTSAMTDKSLENHLQQLQATISSQQGYKFIYVPAFPCNVSLHQSEMIETKRWEKEYQFTFEDIEKGTHFLVRDHRRTLIYRATVISKTGDIEEFSPKRINNVRFPLQDMATKIESQNLIDAIIDECRERNNF